MKSKRKELRANMSYYFIVYFIPFTLKLY